MKKNLVVFTLLILSLSVLFAAPGPDFHKKGHKNFHGKRMVQEDSDFRLLVLTTENNNESCNFELIFSQPVNPDSINSENFVINGKIIPLENLRFSKNYRTVDFFIETASFQLTEENVELIIKDIESINGNKIETVTIPNLQSEKVYRLQKKDLR